MILMLKATSLTYHQAITVDLVNQDGTLLFSEAQRDFEYMLTDDGICDYYCHNNRY